MASVTIKNLPEDLHAKLKELAKQDHRSLNQEILLRLRCGISAVRTRADVEAQIARLEKLDRELLASGYQPPDPEEIIRRIREDRQSH